MGELRDLLLLLLCHYLDASHIGSIFYLLLAHSILYVHRLSLSLTRCLSLCLSLVTWWLVLIVSYTQSANRSPPHLLIVVVTGEIACVFTEQ